MLHALIKITARAKKRLGRGVGSGKGAHTVGRGSKGHTSREGGTIPLWFEGGQLPLVKRLPYLRGKGHFQALAQKPLTIQLGSLSRFAGGSITPETLVAQKVIRSVNRTVKIVAGGDVPAIKEVRGVAVSAAARQALEKIGAIIV